MKNLFEANKNYLLSSLIFSTVFLLIFFIYKLDIFILIYGIIVYIGISTPIIVYRYSKYNKSENILKSLKGNDFHEDFNNISFHKNGLEKSFYELYVDKNKRLVKEKEDNYKLLKEKDEYLTAWVHQIKTPMAVISLISEKYENNQIKGEILKANEYIDQMINYMKFESLSQDYTFRKVNLKKLLNNSVKKYRLFFSEKDLYIKIDIEDIEVVTDEKWLSFVFKQIILNGIKYTEKGGIKIYTEKENPYIIHIKDTGIGIS